jgi:hypothetical protein
LRGKYVNRDTGEEILLARSGISEILRHDGGDMAHIQSIAAIPHILETGIYVDSIDNEDREKHPRVEKYDYYVVGLKVGNEDYTVKAAIATDRDGNRYYDHALTELEKRKLLDEAARVTSSPRHQGGSQEDLLSGYKDKRLLSILQAPVAFKDIKNIKTATGWERGADGQWVYDEAHVVRGESVSVTFEQEKAREGQKKNTQTNQTPERTETGREVTLEATNGMPKEVQPQAEQNFEKPKLPDKPSTTMEQHTSYAALARAWHEKDISEAMSFVGQSKQVDLTAPEAVKQLSLLEAHNNLLSKEEATIVKLHTNGEALKAQYPFLHERVMQKGKDFKEVVDSACRDIEAITQDVKEKHGGQWTFDSILKAKSNEAEVMQHSSALPGLSKFHELRISNNREIAYQLNQTADIQVFVEAAGYKKKGATERWPRYEKGESVLLVTGHNTVKDVKSGESHNLFAFIKQEFPNTTKASDTVHFINTVMKYPESERSGALHLGWQQQRQPAEHKGQEATPAAKKTFSLSDFRLEPLDTGKNYLHDQRGIDKETLEHPNFKGAILQGNRLYRMGANGMEDVPKWQNNVIYPFKTSPDAANTDMPTLLQQYGKKFQVGDKMADKIFAPGDGRHHAAWFSKPPAKVEHLFVMENPLDALSHYQLHKPDNALYMATGGRPAVAQLALIDEVCKKHNIPNRHLSFDNDMAGHSFDAQYIAHKTPSYGIKSVPNSNEKEFVVEYRQLKPEQYEQLKNAAKDKPDATCKDNGSIEVRVKTPEELSRCNKYAAKFLAEDKTLHFTKSKSKDFNDDLKAALPLKKLLPAKASEAGMKM